MRQRLLDPARGPATVEGGKEVKVGATAEVGVERRRFDEAGDPLQRPDAGLGIAAEEADTAGAGRDQAQHHPQRGGLTGTVWSEVAEDVTGLDGQVDVVNRDQLAVALTETADLDRRRFGHAQSALAAASAAAGGTEPTTM
jgi:hypothetical protein